MYSVMRKGLYLLLVINLLAVVGCGGSPDGSLLIDSFEDKLNRDTVDYGSDPQSSLKVEAARNEKMCGRQSIKLDYTLVKDGYMYCARGYGLDVPRSKWIVPNDEINWGGYSGISVQVFGSKSGTIAFDVKDSGNELHRFLIKDDFVGWTNVTIPFQAFKARTDWQPNNAAKNSSIDFPLRSFQFEPKTPGKNVLYFDCVKLTR